METSYVNTNPLDKHTQDCAYRGLSLFLQIPWIKAVFELVLHATNKGLVNFTYTTNITSYLSEKGYTRQKPPRKGMSVNEFAKEVARPGKIYLLALKTPRHITFINPDGVLLDTWDCSSKPVQYYWEK